MAKTSKDSSVDTSLDDSPFVTTSDVLNSLNKALSDSEDPNDIAKPRFELQRRLPDNSTRRATPSELAAADMEAKLSQTATHVSSLKTWKEKLDWAEAQRQYGNQLYQQERYEEAIDVYLTCLTVVDEQKEKEEHLLLFFKVMNNLAQSTLQLKWYNKTEQFCTIALEHVLSKMNLSIHIATDEQRLQTAKLYFKRGKARRLRGLYKDARLDLAQSLEWLDARKDTDVASERRAIEKELELVGQAASEGRRNKERQQRAMQKVLGEAKTSPAAKNEPSAEQHSLYTDDAKRKRAYSTVRAPLPANQDLIEEDDDEEEIEVSFWQWYLVLVGRVAEKLLEWMGDEEYVQQQSKED